MGASRSSIPRLESRASSRRALATYELVGSEVDRPARAILLASSGGATSVAAIPDPGSSSASSRSGGPTATSPIFSPPSPAGTRSTITTWRSSARSTNRRAADTPRRSSSSHAASHVLLRRSSTHAGAGSSAGLSGSTPSTIEWTAHNAAASRRATGIDERGDQPTDPIRPCLGGQCREIARPDLGSDRVKFEQPGRLVERVGDDRGEQVFHGAVSLQFGRARTPRGRNDPPAARSPASSALRSPTLAHTGATSSRRRSTQSAVRSSGLAGEGNTCCSNSTTRSPPNSSCTWE